MPARALARAPPRDPAPVPGGVGARPGGALSFILIRVFAPALLGERLDTIRSPRRCSRCSARSRSDSKVGALLDTRRRAALAARQPARPPCCSWHRDGLGAWLCLMLWPLQQRYESRSIRGRLGLYAVLPAAIGYATSLRRLFDATVVIRRSVIYTGLAGLITGPTRCSWPGTNALLAQTDLTRSPWVLGRLHVRLVVAALQSPARAGTAGGGPHLLPRAATTTRSRCARWRALCRACSTWTRSPDASHTSSVHARPATRPARGTVPARHPERAARSPRARCRATSSPKRGSAAMVVVRASGDLVQVEQARHRARQRAHRERVVVRLAEEGAVHRPRVPARAGD